MEHRDTNGYTAFIITLIAYLLIGTIVIMWLIGCGETSPIQPITVNVPPSPDTIKVREIQAPKGAILDWKYRWSIRDVEDDNGDLIFGKFRLRLFVSLSNIGDRSAIDIKHFVSAKTNNGKSATLEPTDEISPISLEANSTMDDVVYFYNGEVDENIFIQNTDKPAGLKISLKYTWKTAEKE